MPTVKAIQGIECPIPDQPKIGTIYGNKRKEKEQHYRRQELPQYMQPEYIEFDTDGDPVYTVTQRNFVFQELDRCANGYWIMVRGSAVWIPGAYYYWLTYWTLEDGGRPEYRECDRLFFIFFITCYKIPYIAAIIRGKARREGATSHGTCIEMWISTNAAGFGGNKRCGNISKTGEDVDDMYDNMLLLPFKALPIFLRPRMEGGSDPKNEMSFRKGGSKKQQAAVADTSRQGLNSIITKRDTTLNAYDSGRWSFILIDEPGKWLRVDIGKYWRIVKDVLVKGASRVGFAYLPSTVNPPNKGGSNFQRLWKQASQYEHALNKLPQQMVKFFKPAYDGLAGFIDRYGDSVIDPPDEETLEFLREKNAAMQEESERIPEEYLRLGAKKYLELKIALLTDQEDISEERRKYPVKESDMFDFGDSFSPFNIDNINAQIKFLKDNPVTWRRGKLIPHQFDQHGNKGLNIQFHDDKQGLWLIRELPKMPNAFIIDKYGIVRPLAQHLYGGGVDTFRFDKTKQLGSNGCICIGSKMDISKPEGEEGGKIAAFFLGRPKLTELFWKEILMANLFYGCTSTVEKDATQEFIKYFKNTMPNFLNSNCLPMLGKKPDIAIDTTRKKKKEGEVDYGTASSDPFVFAKQIELGQVFIEKYCHLIELISLLESLALFDVDDRTKFDDVIGFLMMLLNITGDFKQRSTEKKKYPVAQQYPIGGGLRY